MKLPYIHLFEKDNISMYNCSTEISIFIVNKYLYCFATCLFMPLNPLFFSGY